MKRWLSRNGAINICILFSHISIKEVPKTIEMKFTYPIISAILLYAVSASGDNGHAFPGAVGIVDHDDKRAQEAFQ
jgi:hypothetical protein